MHVDEKRTVEEAYSSATTTSNLRVVADANTLGDAETIMAAGMSKSLAGACFIRLHGEWSRSEKPRMPGAEEVKKLAQSLTFDQLVKARTDLKLASIGNMKPSAELSQIAAHAMARSWFVAECGLLVGKLQSFRGAVGYLVGHMAHRKDDRPEPVLRQIATEVLIWWLDHQCPVCNGTKYELVPGTNRQSNRPCRPYSQGGCSGTGVTRPPRQDDGRRLANYIDDCCQVARDSIKKRLRRGE